MGFYGNITSATKVGFSFDKIYPNRRDLETYCKTDGVYLGRFVLIDYDQDDENIRRVYSPANVTSETKILYADEACSIPIQFNSAGMITDNNGLVTGVNINDIVYLLMEDQKRIHYICIGASDENPSLAAFKIFTDNNEVNKWNYAINYNIDQKLYGGQQNSIGRGWDSTVWQKVYENGKEQYVMVAELNGVVPSFAISADAPTLSPIAPHFDEVSNNTYYELHWQPQWGMRVRHAGNKNDVFLSGEVNTYPSDEKMTWIQSFYNKDKDANFYYYYGTDGEWHFLNSYTEDQKEPNFENIVKEVQQKENGLLPAAIYYNKAGFNPAKHYSSDITDRLQINPTGYSQKPLTYNDNGEAESWELSQYNDHTRGLTSPQVDTQELSMILPSLGNAMNDIWDTVYGVGVDEKGKQAYLVNNKGELILNELGRPQAKKNTSYDRLTFIDWTDPENDLDKLKTKRLRLVNEKDENGFTFSKDEVDTLAGCINSVHDLMGMIIVDKKDKEPNDGDVIFSSSDDKIYYFNDGEYYRKVKAYNYLDVDYICKKITLTEATYEKDIYYYTDEALKTELNDKIEIINNNEELDEIDKNLEIKKLIQEYKVLIIDENYYFKDLDKVFDENKTYYYKTLKNKTDQYSSIELEEFDPVNNPIYFQEKENYLREDSEIARSVNYYKIKPENPKKFKYAYAKNLFYFKNGNNYYKAEDDKHIPNVPYYYLEWGKHIIRLLNPIEDLQLYDSATGLYNGEDAVYLWAPGIFWTYNEQTTQYTKAMEYNKNEQYYLCSFTVTLGDPDPTSPSNPLVETYNIIDTYKVKVIEDYQNHYYLNDQNGFSTITQNIYENFIRGNYYKGDPDEEYDKDKMPFGYLKDSRFLPDFNIKLEENIYYMIQSPEKIDDFYYPNMFYYNKDSNYILDSNEDVTEDRQYYLKEDLNLLLFGENFYKPNTFYYDVDNHLPTDGIDFIPVIDAAIKKTPGRKYYIKNNFYVKSDEKGLYSVGARWPYSVDVIPQTIEIANREEGYELKPLVGFARNLNTIHGLILQINNLLLLNDEYTRDRKTVQGTINTLNDIINKFMDLKPGKPLITDNYGIVRNADFKPDKWLQIDVDANVDAPAVYFNHLYPNKGVNTSDATDMNDLVNDKINDKINIQSISFDEKGHVTKWHREEYTLPYGYKEFLIQPENNETAALTYQAGNIIADNTQDTITLGSGNKWIKIAANADNDTLLFGHEIHDIDTSAKDDTDFNAGTGGPNGTPLDSIIIQDIQFDAAGHVTHNQNHKYKLPNSYGVFSTDENGVTAKSVCDTFNFAGDKWIGATIDNDLATLKITHRTPSDVTKSAGQDKSDVVLGFNDNFKSVYVETDANGHVVTLEEKILTLPNLDESKVSLLNLKYDFNDDGIVDEKDSEMLAKHVTGISIIADKELLARMDINGDGVVDAADMSILSWLIANSDVTVSEAITNLSISSRDMKSDISNINNKITNMKNNITDIGNDITNIENNINNIETLLGITEGTTALTVEEQIAAAFEAFKTDVLKDYALKTYVDDEIEKATQVDTNTII